MNKVLIWTLVLFFPLACIAQGEGSYEELVSGIKNKSQKMINYSADVILTVHSDLFLEPSSVSYEMNYIKPDRFRIEKKEGDFETIIINGNEVFRSENNSEFISLGEAGVMNVFNELISQVISGDYFDNEDFEVEYAVLDSTYTIELVPKRKVLARRVSKVELLLDKHTFAIKEFVIYEDEFNFFSYLFNSIDYNTEVSSKLFSP